MSDPKVDKSISPSGLLPGKEYKLRRSQTLIDNPHAQLDERKEIQKYFERLDSSYLKELKEMNNSVGWTMSKDCRLTISIPAYLEGKNIKKTLELYTNQNDEEGNSLDPNVFELVVLNNHPKDVPEDETLAEVEKFREENPKTKVIYTHKQWSSQEPATVGHARKYLADISLLRNISRPKAIGEFFLVINDADAIGVDEHYITDILSAFKTHPEADAFALKWSWPDKALQKPNFYAANFFWDGLLHFSEHGLGKNGTKEPAQIEARNGAIRSAMYAAVGGFNRQARNAEDLEMSWMIADARNWNPRSVARLDVARITTNPRRPLSALASGIPLNEMYLTFQSNPEIRKMDDNQLLEMIPDDFDLNLFEKELKGWYVARGRNEFKFLGPRYMPIYAKIMKELGIDYKIVGDDVKITNAKKFLNRLLKDTRRKVGIFVESKVEKTTPSEAKALRKFVSGTTYGFEVVRANRAKEIAVRIDAVEEGKEIKEGDKNKIRWLRKEYKRFTHRDYKRSNS